MSDSLVERLILYSPMISPPDIGSWTTDGQPTNRVIDRRRLSDLTSPVPKRQEQRRTRGQRPDRLGDQVI